MPKFIKRRRQKKRQPMGVIEVSTNLVLPFGFTKGPSTIQQLMYVVHHELDDPTTAYQGKNIIFSPTLGEHIKQIQKVFDLLDIN